jgi:hypothetical protein
MGLVAAVVWVARGLLKRWIDGPEVTAQSGGWPAPAGPAVKPTPSGSPQTPGTPAPEEAPAEVASRPSTDADRDGAAVSEAPKRRSRRVDRSEPGSWVVPNGTSDVLATHPVKVKLSSRVYRVPGMPLYDRTVADRCYASVEAAETDGFNRAAR